MDVFGPKDDRYVIRASRLDRGRLESAVNNMLSDLLIAQQEFPRLRNDPVQKEMVRTYKDMLDALRNPKEV